MNFICPQCNTSGSLRITAAIELPPDSRSDEITLQAVSCSSCGFRGLAVYEESRRGGLDSESWNHTGYRVDASVVKSALAAIRSCPHPRDARCQCAAHKKLGRRNQYGAWQGPAELDDAESFVMRRAR